MAAPRFWPSISIRPKKQYARELAVRWTTTEAAIKMAVHRLRRRLGTLLRLEVAHTVDDPGQVKKEIRFLLSAIGLVQAPARLWAVRV